MNQKQPVNDPASRSVSGCSRRQFLQTTGGAAAFGTAFGLGHLQQSSAAEARGDYRVGLIGAGWYGKSDVFRLIQVAPVDVVAVCDPDQNMLSGAAELISQRQKSKQLPKMYGDYRKLLDENQLDIVVIGSPDHWHALQTIAAVESGADVYVQKPTSVDVLEGEAMVAAARKHNRVVQVGTQRKSTPHLIDAKQRVIDSGLLGKVAHVDMCCYFHMRANGNPPLQPVPDFLDYEMWTGPAPLRPYDGLPHRRWWRTFMEYGNGIMGDMCVHMLDTARWMLDLGWPKQIGSAGGIFVQKDGKSNIADTQSATFLYDDMTLSWQHRSWGSAPDPDYPWALTIHGEKGMLKASTMQADFIPRDRNVEPIHFDCLFEREEYPEDVGEKDIELNAAPATRLHMRDFLQAIEKRSRPIADIEEGHISSASCILANMAMELNRTLQYDPVKREVVGDAEATALLRRDYRSPWKYPDV